MKTKWFKIFYLLVLALTFLFLPWLVIGAEGTNSQAGMPAALAPGSAWLAIIPVLVPVIIAALKLVLPNIPTVWLPVLAPVLGAVADILLYYAGVPGTGSGIAGAILGSAGVGLREIVDQIRKLPVSGLK